jgi:hypothetical protein
MSYNFTVIESSKSVSMEAICDRGLKKTRFCTPSPPCSLSLYNATQILCSSGRMKEFKTNGVKFETNEKSETWVGGSRRMGADGFAFVYLCWADATKKKKRKSGKNRGNKKGNTGVWGEGELRKGNKRKKLGK